MNRDLAYILALGCVLMAMAFWLLGQAVAPEGPFPRDAALMADGTGRGWHGRGHPTSDDQMIVRLCSHCGLPFRIRLASRFVFCRPCWESLEGNEWIRRPAVPGGRRMDREFMTASLLGLAVLAGLIGLGLGGCALVVLMVGLTLFRRRG